MAIEQYHTTVTSDAGESVEIVITQFGADKGAEIFFQFLAPIMRAMPKALEGVAPMMQGVAGELRAALEDLQQAGQEAESVSLLDRPLDQLVGDTITNVLNLFSTEQFVEGLTGVASGVAEAAALVAEYIVAQGSTKTIKALLSHTARINAEGKKQTASAVWAQVYRGNYGELLETIVHVLIANYRDAMVSLGKRLVPAPGSNEG